jgi:hypothetical protein
LDSQRDVLRLGLTQSVRGRHTSLFLAFTFTFTPSHSGIFPSRSHLASFVFLHSGNTKLFCSWTCIKDYGFANVILNRLSQFPDNLPDGELRPCIECDELASGPGFKYGSGRTRRNSGIESNIKRDPGEISKINHWAYFK